MADSSSLARAVEEFNQNFQRISADATTLMSIRDEFIENVTASSPIHGEKDGRNPLVKAGKEMERQIAATIKDSAQAWDARQATRELADLYADKVIFLVFGKVNAGKSSFCNYLASTFPAERVRFFYLEAGKVVDTDLAFKEGVTETTARIQGVELGGKLILLDSPGLHSVTDKNGKLTKLFTDSADAVLWLTPSTSPGQVQELDDLMLEIKSGKPLLPLITKSDFKEEDIDDTGEIIEEWVNKSPDNRKLQEGDVLKRAKEKVGEQTKIGRPISVSVHAYLKSSGETKDLQESGLSALLDQAAALVHQAADYKPKKARQQIINYLEHSVLQVIREQLLPAVVDLDKRIESEHVSLVQRRQETLSKLRQELSERVNDWAEELKETEDRAKLATYINTLVTERLTAELRDSVEQFVGDVKTILVQIDEEDIGTFEDVEIKYEQVSGRALQAASSSAGSIGGAGAGFLLGGPLGAIIGGMLGGLLGGAGGSLLVETDVVKQKVGVDATQAVNDTLKALDRKLPSIVTNAFSPWHETLTDMACRTSKIRSEIGLFEKNLDNAKQGMRDECH
ncbi:GTPase [Salinisphaera hydrothermalis]|uniref:GTPase n=1 Tax=Salinisphaera hydrothermalis TaxID=563188 RepID=UPI0033421117